MGFSVLHITFLVKLSSTDLQNACLICHHGIPSVLLLIKECTSQSSECPIYSHGIHCSHHVSQYSEAADLIKRGEWTFYFLNIVLVYERSMCMYVSLSTTSVVPCVLGGQKRV